MLPPPPPQLQQRPKQNRKSGTEVKIGVCEHGGHTHTQTSVTTQRWSSALVKHQDRITNKELAGGPGDTLGYFYVWDHPSNLILLHANKELMSNKPTEFEQW
jgi:hypothetical protein